MADIDLTFGKQIPPGTIFKYRDMGDGTHAEVVAADVVLDASDIEIGAVEIKNSGDDTRATVGANGLYVEIRAQPANSSLTDAQLRATPVPVSGTVEVTNDAGNPLPVNGTISVTNAGGYSAPLTITRPANQTPYTAGDVVGGALTFPTMGPNAGRILLTSAQLEYDVAAIPAGMSSFNLYLYNVTPPSAIADNSAFDIPSGDRASFLGKIALGSPVDEISTLYAEVNAINKQLKLAGTSIFGYLVTVGGYTPAGNSETIVLTLHSIAV